MEESLITIWDILKQSVSPDSVRYSVQFNNNMGYIETLLSHKRCPPGFQFNNNMGYIETTLVCHTT